MKIFMPEHSKAAYFADFLIYGIAILMLALFLLIAGPRAQALELTGLVVSGVFVWTAVEYLIHRFILHGVQPFQRWHDEHHRRPAALIRTPTLLSASLILALVFFPALLFSSHLWRACALTLGMLLGYFIYTVTHHAIHHSAIQNAWLKRRQHWHGLHHDHQEPGRYGVTSKLWDSIFRSN
ncbi:sterol desaturase family protein [Undibacterium sp. Ji22W]|uniref:sterol desaturase family protein n=1 Tax=Undibacterium sp. Ji22W TaxID=3413038 RepID=UPI003BEFAE29